MSLSPPFSDLSLCFSSPLDENAQYIPLRKRGIPKLDREAADATDGNVLFQKKCLPRVTEWPSKVWRGGSVAPSEMDQVFTVCPRSSDPFYTESLISLYECAVPI